MRYSQEVHKFIRANVEGISNRELVDLVNAKFGELFTESKMRSYKKNHKLKSGIGTARKAGYSVIFTPEMQNFIKDNVKGRTPEEVAEMLNKAFGTQYTVSQIRSYKQNHKLPSGLDFTFKRGHTPFNKGIKGICAPGSEKGWFKKGNKSINHRPVGSERVDVDGYTLIKTAEPNKWELKHRLIYIEKHGAIPEDHIVIFLDGDKSNLDIDNLMAISKAESAILNHQKLRFANKELTKTGVMISKVKLANSKLRKGRQDNGHNNDTRGAERTMERCKRV